MPGHTFLPDLYLWRNIILFLVLIAWDWMGRNPQTLGRSWPSLHFIPPPFRAVFSNLIFLFFIRVIVNVSLVWDQQEENLLKTMYLDIE